MSQQDTVDRVVASLHDAMLGDAHWREASIRFDEACGTQGTHLVIVDGSPGGSSRTRPEWLFDQCWFHGEPRGDARSYADGYYPRDERIPRLMRLPDRRVTHVTELYTARELKTSPTYNEVLRAECQDGLNVRMDGPDGLDVVLALADPVAAAGWNSDRLETIAALLPHVRQFVRVRHALVRAEALGVSGAALLDNTTIAVIYLDRRGTIIEANARAGELLRQNGGLSAQHGVLRAALAIDDDKLGRLLEDALPERGRQAAGGSMTVERSPTQPRLVVHVNPLVSHVHRLDFAVRSPAVLVLVVDPGDRTSVDAELVAATFRLTRAESQVAAA